MNKILLFIKNILSLLVLTLIIIFSIRFDTIYFVFITLYIIYLITSFRDFIKKDKIIKNNTYNIISVLFFLLVGFIFLRALMDSGFIYNSKYYMDILKNGALYPSVGGNETTMIIEYVNQNMVILTISLVLVLLYRYLNTNHKLKEYYSTSLLLMVISIASIIPSIYVLTLLNNHYADASFSAIYLFIVLLLMGFSVFRLIQGKYKNKIWMLYITLSFYLLGFISCIIQIRNVFKIWL